MDWNTKWDWENLVSFGSKPTETTSSPKKLPFADLFIDGGEEEEETDTAATATGSFNLSTPSSDQKTSSLSASTESSSQNPTPKPSSKEADKEPLIGLKLGKRTYFENTGSGHSSGGAAATKLGSASSSSHKPTKSSCRPIPRCVVESCGNDLSTAKEYHRKHKVCETHSKCSKVIVGGLERRFCQQCSRFHSLSEFDEKKRSCRRRLMDHNARRRKPQPETTFSSSPFFYGGGKEHMTSFLLGNVAAAASHFHPRNYCGATTIWDNSKFTVMSTQGQFASSSTRVSTVSPMIHSSSTQMEAAVPVFDQGHGRALSLLSTDSWGSCGAESSQLLPPPPATHYQQVSSNLPPATTEPVMMHPAVGEGLALSSGEFFLPRDARVEDIHDFRTPYEPDFYHNILN